MERAGRRSASEPRERGPCSPLLGCPAASAPLWPRISADPHSHFRGPPRPETPSPPIQRQKFSFRSSAGLSHRLAPLGAGRGLALGGLGGRISEAPLRLQSPPERLRGARPESLFLCASVSSPPAGFRFRIVVSFPCWAGSSGTHPQRRRRRRPLDSERLGAPFYPLSWFLSVSSLFPSSEFHRSPPPHTPPPGCHSSLRRDSLRPRPFTGLSRELPAARWLALAGRRRLEQTKRGTLRGESQGLT